MVVARFWRIALVVSLVALLMLLTSLKGSSALDSTLDSLGSYIPLKPLNKSPQDKATDKNVSQDKATDQNVPQDKATDKEKDKSVGDTKADKPQDKNTEGAKDDKVVAKDWPFPKKIWQTDKSIKKDAEKLKLINSWYEMNPTFRYELLNDYGAEDFVRKEFKNLPKLRDAYLNTPDVILRADMLRILVMYATGGVYSDTDTECLVPIHEWVPKKFLGKANLVVGFETERSRDEGIPQEAKDEVKVCQWTLLSMAKNKHVLGIMDHIVDNLHALADRKGVKFEELGKHLNIPEVIGATGPAEVTVGLQASLSNSLGETIDRRNMSGYLEPFMLDDVLFLPVNAFAGHQQHSHSGSAELGPLLVKHYYGSSWWKVHGNGEKEKGKDGKKEKARKG